MIQWTDAPNGSAGHVNGRLVVQLRRLGVGGWSAGWRNGMKWDVSDQSTQIKEQSSRYFETREAAKKAVETYLRTVCEKASMDALGRWREPNPHIASTSKLQWIAPARTGIQTWVGVIEGHKVATIKRQPGNVGSTCTALLDGWIWDMSKVVPNALGIAESVARGFESVPAAKKAIGQAIRVHPNNN